MDLVFSLQHGLANEYVRQIKPIRSNAPATLPDWIPPEIREAALSGHLRNGVSRFAGPPPYGRIVVWIDNSSGYLSIQAYQEFPDKLEFYVRIADGDEHRGRLLRECYTQFNRDMTFFLDSRGMSPEMARDEIRRINDEVLRLVLEAAVGILSAGAGISAMNNIMRQNANKMLGAAERSGFSKSASQKIGSEMAGSLRRAGKPVVVNLGGVGEELEAINLNPNKVAPRKDIPNLIAQEGEAIEQLFEPGSVDKIVSNRLPPNTLDWRRIIPGAQKVLKPGGTLTIRFQGTGYDSEVIVAELKRLGFKQIEDFKAVVTAVK